MSFLVGLAKTGGECVKADKPGIFENLDNDSVWIIQAMGDANYPYQY